MTTLQARPEVDAGRVLDRVRELVPLLRANAQRAEDERNVPAENIAALTEAGVYRLGMPRSRGGFEADVALQNEVLAEIARGCASTSWVVTIGMATNWMVALFPDEAQDEVYATPDLRTAGVISPTGTGTRTEGGAVVTGTWAFNTGCRHAQWALLALLMEEPDGTRTPYVSLIPYGELAIADDWHATGMAGTGSHTTTAADVFVPDHRLMPVANLGRGHYPGSTEAAENPYFGRPGIPVLLATCAGTPQGIARGAMDLFLQRLPGRKITYTDYASQAAAPITHLQLAHAQLTSVSMDAHVARIAALVDGRVATGLDLLSRAAVRAHAGHTAQLARDVVDTLFQASGASAIRASVDIQRSQRDIQALALHAFLQSTTTDEMYGRVLLGLEPNTNFL